MIANVNDVVNWLTLNNLNRFVVYVKENDNSRVFESNEALTFQDNVDKFRRAMEYCTGNRFIIKASEKQGDKRGMYYEEFKNINEPINNANTAVIQGLTDIDVEKRIAKAITEYQTKTELERLREENKELMRLASKGMTVTEQFMERAQPFIPQLAGMLMNVVGKFIPATGAGTVALAGLEQAAPGQKETQPINNDIEMPEQERINAALEKWANADTDFIALLEKIADLAASGDAKYSTAKMFI